MHIFAKRFFDFRPIEHPAICFGLEGNRDALIRASAPGDLLAIVGTQGEPTPAEERGRLLGLVEFARVAVQTADIVDKANLRPYHFKPDGSLAWPSALPVLSAWTFDEPRLKLVDALKEQLTFEATMRAVRLDEEDARMVLAIPRTEVQLPHHPLRERLRDLATSLSAGRPTTGPSPTEWIREVTRDPDAEAWTYLMRFGRRDVWKIGHTQDVGGRLQEVNKHVPHEALGERWSVVMRQRWPNSYDAYAMEQRLFRELSAHRTEGERLRCPETVLESAWIVCLSTS